MTWLLSCAEHRDAQTEDHTKVNYNPLLGVQFHK